MQPGNGAGACVLEDGIGVLAMVGERLNRRERCRVRGTNAVADCSVEEVAKEESSSRTTSSDDDDVLLRQAAVVGIVSAGDWGVH